jgi:hypothetical protein
MNYIDFETKFQSQSNTYLEIDIALSKLTGRLIRERQI